MMIVIPELSTYENVFPFDLAFLEHRPHCFAHLFFISVPLSTIELTKAYLQRHPNCLFCYDRIRDQRPEAECRDLISAVIELGRADHLKYEFNRARINPVTESARGSAPQTYFIRLPCEALKSRYDLRFDESADVGWPFHR